MQNQKYDKFIYQDADEDADEDSNVFKNDLAQKHS